MEIKMLVVMLRNAADELDRIEGALGTLQGLNAGPKRKGNRGKRVMSPEARARIAAAQKKRWAKQKKGTTA